jgi:acetyl esterase
MNKKCRFTALWLLTAACIATAGVLPNAEVVVYKKVGNHDLRLYIVKPLDWKSTDRRPAIVFFHGGGWVAGGPGQFAWQSDYLATRGMVGICAEYRLIPKDNSTPPIVCCQDAKSAMRYVRAHAAELGVDPNRIAAAGGSAGGHLAAFTALVPGLNDPADDLQVSCKPEALVLFNPVFNNGPGNYGYKRVGNRYQEFSPAQNITSNAPPTIVFFGTQDQLVPIATIKKFQNGMERCGVRCETFLYGDQNHGFFNQEPYKTFTLIETDKFLASLGWIEGPPTLKSPPTTLAKQLKILGKQ